MTIEKLKSAVADGNDFYFTYEGIRAGVECTVIDSVETYDVWYGDIEKSYDNLDDVLNDPIFGGHTIAELLASDAIEIDYA